MHPNKKRKPKHTAVFRYDNSGHPIRTGASRRCKAFSINHPVPDWSSFKYERYLYSRVIWQDIKYVYTAREPKKRRNLIGKVR